MLEEGFTCHNCRSNSFVISSQNDAYFLPAAIKRLDGLEPLPKSGLPVRAYICKDCGYVHFIHAKDLVEQ